MTLLVKSVRVLGGERNYPEPVDVLVNGGSIAAVGSLEKKSADRVIDGRGMYIAPGFIDIHAETDHYLDIFRHPLQDDVLSQGVTTMLCGHEGTSLAPLLYGTLESFEEWTDTDGTNIDWHTVAEFLARLDRRPLGANFATLVGHSTIRRALIGEHLRDLTKNELAVFVRVLDEALADGAFGLSANLKSVYGRKTPYAELKMLAERVARKRGVVFAGLRKAVTADIAVDEVIKLAGDANVTTVVSNFLPIAGQRDAYERALEKIEGRSADADTRIFFEIAPFDADVRPLYRFLPDWAQTGGLDDMMKHAADEWMKPRLMKDFASIEPDNMTIVRARHNSPLVGLTLAEFMALYELKDPHDALYKLMMMTRLRALVAYRTLDPAMVLRAVSHPDSLISAKGVSVAPASREHVKHPVDHGNAFPRFIELMLKEKLMSLEHAVRKLTEVPAKLIGLKKRGVIAEGAVADLCGFDVVDGAVNVRFVALGGKLVLENAEPVETCAGKVLRA